MMQHPRSIFFTLATTAMLVIANPLHAQTEQVEEAEAMAPLPLRLQVTSADEIVGEELESSDDEDLGEIEYLLINLQSGNVGYALVGKGDFIEFSEELVAVPWSAIQMVDDDDLQIDITEEQFEQAPTITEERIAELTEPAVITQVYEYFAQPTADDTAPGAEQGEGDAPQQAQTEATGDQPYVMVGREIVTMVMPPAMMPADNITGTDVETAGGEEVGEVDKLMIDVAHGQVAYVLLTQGGFLGFGEEWIPVPLGALQWSVEEENLVLNVAEEQLQKLEGLPKEDLPSQVRVDHLQTLYENYGIEPYWQRMASQQQSS